MVESAGEQLVALGPHLLSVGSIVVGPVELRHRALGDVAPFGHLPLVVDLEEDRSGEAQHRPSRPWLPTTQTENGQS